MNIGVYLSISESSLSLFRYANTLISAISKDIDNNYFLFYKYNDYPKFLNKKANWRVVSATDEDLYVGFWGQMEKYFESVLHILCKRNIIPFRIKKMRRRLYERAKELDVELMIYPWTDHLSFEIGIPYIIIVHDLQHRLNPEFKEVSDKGVRVVREYSAKYGCEFAHAIFVDSEVGKKDVLKYYNVKAERIVVLPFVTPVFGQNTVDCNIETIESVKKKYCLPDKFIFYPASFQPHKNHKALIYALHHIHEKYGERIPCVLTGPKAGAYETITKLIDTLAMNDQIRYLGYVDHAEIKILYKIAYMMVMPTYFGPTNMPIVEAWQAGCPVISSDIDGIREQVGEAGILVNPDDYAKLASSIYEIYTNECFRIGLIRRGYQEVEHYNFENYTNIVITAIKTATRELERKKRDKKK